jgi:hypothetical protein
MRYEDRFCPVGKVEKWYNGAWQEPGLCGRVTPVLPVVGDWYSAQPDAYWGPSVHWNHYLHQYVILLNRAIDPSWKQEGIYVSFNPDLSDPLSWTAPIRILDEKGWYPQVIGMDMGKADTDREVGQTARLFIHGVSNYLIHFSVSEKRGEA